MDEYLSVHCKIFTVFKITHTTSSADALQQDGYLTGYSSLSSHVRSYMEKTHTRRYKEAAVLYRRCIDVQSSVECSDAEAQRVSKTKLKLN
jgi:hypothetical protein